MALKVTLRRGERLFIGGSSIRNENQSTVLLVDGNDPVLREREMLSAETADTPAKKLVLALQHIYLSERFDELHELYIVFARELLAALPDAAPFIASIDESIA